jgi:hypothetical protein
MPDCRIEGAKSLKYTKYKETQKDLLKVKKENKFT